MIERGMIDVDAARFLADLHALRAFGRVGTGVVRPALSDADMAARRWLAERFRDAGLTPVFDPLGSLFGLPDGFGGPCLLVGSHSDSQPEGGWLDGALGVVCGLEAARAARAAGGPPLAVVSFQDEEGRFGGLAGSRYFAGKISLAEAEALTDAAGDRLGALRRAHPECVGGAPVDPRRFAGFLEAHIEQGVELESRGLTIGAVEAIVGARQWRLRLIGEQNHAGAARMARRRDALRGFTRFYAALDAAMAPLAAEATVWTIGRLAVSPNADSIVPGAVEAEVQMRDADPGRLDRMEAAMRAAAERVAVENGLGFEIEASWRIEPTPMDASMIAAVESAAAQVVGDKQLRMTSGAVHDAMALAGSMPVGMAFCPSIGGISHSFAEDTAPDDLVACARVVAHAAAAWRP